MRVNPRNVPWASQDPVTVAAGTGGTACVANLSAIRRLAASAVSAVATAAHLIVYSNSPQSLADCAKSFGSTPAAESPYLAENVSTMTKMMIDMGIRPSGDVDSDFVAIMLPHHRGAIEMAQVEQ